MSVPESSDQGLSFLEPDIQTRLLYHGWEGSMASNGTYHPIMLPPYNRLNSKEEAQAWVAKVTRILTSPEPDLDMRSALDYPFNSNDGKGQLILIQTTEFAFNGVEGQNLARNAINYEHFEVCLQGVSELMKSHRSGTNPEPTICLAMSSVVAYPAHTDAQGRIMAENALFVTNNKIEGFQKIVKHAPSDFGDCWDNQRYFDNNPKGKISVNSEERLREHTHSNSDFNIKGGTIAIGFGTCLDSSVEFYPGTHMIVFSGAGMKDYGVVDNGNGGFFWNDINRSHDPGNNGPGWRTWDPPAPSIGEARLTYKLMEEYKAVLASNGKTADELAAATTEATENPSALKRGLMEAKHEQLLAADGRAAEVIRTKIETSRRDPAEMNQRLTAENWSWPSAATGRPWWSNKLEGQKMLLQWEKALLDHGKTYQEIFDIRALGPKIAEMQHVLEGVGVIWPPGLTEMAMYYRSADYIRLENEQEIVDTYNQAFARATIIGEPEPTTVEEIVALYKSGKEQADADGTAFTQRAWAEEVFKNWSQVRDLPASLGSHDVIPRLNGSGGGGGDPSIPDPKPDDPAHPEPVKHPEHPDHPEHHEHPGERGRH